jgi:DNA replication protein DnaC
VHRQSPACSQSCREALEVIESRSVRKSIIVTSQLPVRRWHDYLAGENPTVADAILDRVVTGAPRIELNGASLRGRDPRPQATK